MIEKCCCLFPFLSSGRDVHILCSICVCVFQKYLSFRDDNDECLVSSIFVVLLCSGSCVRFFVFVFCVVCIFFLKARTTS